MSEPATTPVPDPPSDAPEALDPNFRIRLPNFEGPLDLLLHLIRKHELDIVDLPIAFITQEYLRYLDMMDKLNLDVASEYLVMAATLAHIKSKTLLPRPPADQEDEAIDEIDPRADLIRRLLEYQKYKRVAEDLGRRAIEGRDVFGRGTPKPKSESEAPLADLSVFKLLDALQRVAKRVKADFSLEVDAERITIQARMGEVVDTLRTRRSCSFEELFEDVTTTYDLVVTFLALLEMAKMRIVRVYQTDHEEPIHLEYILLDADGQPVEPSHLRTDEEPQFDHDALVADGEHDDELDDGYEDDRVAPRESVVVPAMARPHGAGDTSHDQHTMVEGDPEP